VRQGIHIRSPVRAGFATVGARRLMSDDIAKTSGLKLPNPFSRRPSSAENPIAAAQSLSRLLAFSVAVLAVLNVIQFQDRAALLDQRVPLYPVPIAVSDTRTVAFTIAPMPAGVERSEVIATAKAIEYVQNWYGYVPDQSIQSKFWEPGGWINSRSCVGTWKQFENYRDQVRGQDNGTIPLLQEARNIALVEERPGLRVLDAQIVLVNAKTRVTVQATNLRISLTYEWRPTTSNLADLQRGLLPPNPEGFYACNFVPKVRTQ
jgi:hypothetical protein